MALNRIYKVVWSKTKGCYVVVSELAKCVGRNKAKAIVISSAAMAMAISPIFTSTTGATLNQPGTGDGNGVAWGENSTGTGSSAVAIGRDANASAYQSVAIGKGAISSNNSTVALGQDARATASGASALSVAATASGNNAVAIAYNSNASGTRATAIGEESNASSEDGIALGYKTRATSGSAVAIGREVVSSGDSAVALGKLSKATGRGSLALATEANATGNDSYAIGWRSDASAESTMAFGHSSKAKKNYDIAFGRGAEARDQGSGHSIAIGYGASAASNRGGLDSNTTSTGTLNSAGGVAIGTGAYTGINRGNTAINSSVAVGAGAGAGYRGLGADGLPTGNGTDPDDNATVLVKAFGGTTSTVDYFKNTGSANGDGFFSYQNVDINEATALGRNTRAIGDQSVAIGAQSIAGQGSIVIGGNDIQAYDGKKYFKAANPTSGAATTVNDFNAETTPGTGKNNQPITISAKYAELVGAALDNSYRASYGQDGSTVIGMQAHSTTPLGVAIGTNSIVRKGAFGATAIGSGASVLANAEAAVAIGMGSEAQGNYAVAAGTAARAKESAVAAGYKADAGVSAVSVGDESKAVQSSVAVGQLAQSLQVADIAIGQGAIAKGEQGAIAVGLGTQAQGDSSIMIGGSEITKVAAQPVEYQKEKKDKDGHTVIKTTTKVEHIGGEDVNRTIRSVEMEGANGTIQDAYGELTNGATLDTKTLNYSLPVNKNGHGSISMGIHSLSTGDLGTAIGTGARVTKLGGVALGTGAISELQNGVAIGTGSKADASSIGTRQTDISYDKEGKIVPFDSKKVAYTFYWAGGTNTSEGDVVSFGTPGAERQLKNVAAGRIADDSTDAINGSQLNSVTKRMSSGWAVEAEKDKDSSGVLKLNGAVATAGTEVYSEDGKTTDRVNKGTATGQVDKVRLNDEVKFRVGDNLVLHQQDGSRPVYEDPDNPNRKTGARVTSKFTYSLNPELTNLKSATFKNDAGDTTVINGNGVTVTPVTQGKEAVSLTTTGLNNGGNAISNVASNLPSTKNSDVTTGPSNATTSQEAPNTTNKDGNNYVSPNNAATVGDVLNTGWNLQGNNIAVDFVKPYDTVNFIDGEGTTATVASTDGKISTVKYSVNLGDGLKKDDATNKIIVNAADKSLTVDTNGVKVNPADKSLEVTDAGLKVKTDGTTITTDNTNGLKVVTGEIESVTTGANPGTVKVKDGDAGKVATVDSVVNAVNNAAFTLKASASGGTRNTGSSVTEAGESIKAGSTVEMIAGKNLDVKHDTSGKITFATVDTPSFTTVQVGGDEGPKFSKTADGNISVSDKDGTNPVKITNVKDGDISTDSKDAINGSQFHGLAKNTIKLAGQNGTNAATETNGQNLDQTGGIKFTIKSSDGTLLDVAASGDTITLTPKTGTITTTDGVPTATTTNGKLVTADQLVTALTEMGWKATAGKDGTGTVTGTASELIKAGETVTFKAGDNLAIKQDGKNFIYSLKTELTSLTSGEFKNTAGDKTVINGDGVTITPVTNGKSPVSLTNTGLNNGGNAISNVASNLPSTKNSDVTTGPSNATTSQEAPNTTDKAGNNYVSPNNAATIGDVLNAGWNLQGNNIAVDFVKPYDTVNFIDGEGTTATVASTDGKISTVKYSVNLGDGLKKDDATNKIIVNAADKSLTVDTNGVKVNPADKSLEVTDAGLKVKTDGTTITTDNTNGLKVVTGEIESVTTGANPGTVKVKDGDAGKVATVDSVVNAVNNAAFTLKASASGGTRNTGSSVTEAGESIKAGSTVEMIAGKNLDVKHDTSGKITFATVDTPSFTTVQVGGDEGPKFSKTADGNISVSDKDGTNPVKITNVKDGDISTDSKDAINGSQFHGLAKNTIKLAGQNGTNAATETNGQNLDQTGGIKFTIKSSDGTLLDVAASGDTITLTPKTGTITTTDGVPTATTTNGKLVTADQLVTALTEMGWKATAGKDGTGTVTGTASELIKAGETVTFKAGDNLAIKQDGKNFIYSLKTELTGLTSAEFKDAKNNKVNITPEGITITKPADPTAGTPENTVTLNQNGLNNGGNAISNVKSNLPDTKNSDTANTEAAPSNATKVQAVPNTTNTTGDNYVNPNNAATVSDVLNAGWNLQGNGQAVDFVKAYDTVNFINGDGTTAIVASTDGKTSTVKYNVNVGNGLQKDDTGNTISVKPADSSLVVDGNGVKVNTGTINNVTTGDKPGTVEANTGDENKVATVGNVVNAINNAAWTATSAATAAGELGATAANQLVKAGDTVTFEADKNIKITQNAGKFTFATKDNVSFETVQVGGDQGPKFSKTDAGDIKVSGPNDTDPVKITNVQDGEVSSTSKDAINGSQFHAVAKNTIKLAGQNGTDTATETNGQNLDQTGGIKFTIKSSDGTLLDVAASGDTITLTPKTGTITTTDGVPTATTTNGKLVTADQLVTALTEMGWKATAGQEGTGTVVGNAEELIKAGNTVTFKAGDNLAVKQDGKNFIYSLKTELTGLTSGEFKNTAGDKTVINGDGVTITPVTNGKSPVSLTTNGLNNGGNPITNVTSNLVNYNDPDVNGVQPAKNSLRNLDNNAVPDTNAATVGDLRNMGWIVSSDKTTGSLDKAYTETVKHANEVKFVGEGSVIVSGNTDDKGVRTITVKVDNQTATNNAITPISYTKADGTKVYPKEVTNEDSTKTIKFYPNPDGTGTEVPNSEVITSINGPKGTKSPTTLSNVAGNLDGAKAGTDAPTTKHEAPNTTEATGPNYVNPNNAATVGDVLQAGWNLQNNGTEKDFVKPYDTVNFINGDGTTATVESTDGKTSTVKYSVNLGNGLQKDDTGNTISVKPADSSLVVDGNGVKVNTGTINNVTTGDKPGTVEANTGDENKVATVGNVVNAINNAAWTATSAATAAGELGATAANQLVKAGDTVTFEADKNIKITQNAGKFTFATKDNVSFETVQVGGDQGPKFSKTDAGDIKVSGPNDTDPVKITNVQDGEVSSTSKDAINGSQFHAVAKNTIKLAGQNGTDTATETNGQNLDQTGGIKFTIKSSDGTLLDVAASGDTITLTPKTGTITTTDGVPTATTTNGKLVTADQLVTALTEMGWKATAGKDGTGTVTGTASELIKAGETVTFKAGDNLAIKQDGKNFIYSLKTELTGLTSAEFKDGKNNKVNITPEGITITKPADPTAGTPENIVILNQNGLNNGGNAISNVKSNLPDTKNSDTANTEAAPSNATKVQAVPNTTNTTGDNYVNPNNAATVSDVLNAGWNLQGNGQAVDFVKAYDTVNFINGDGTTAIVASTDGKTSTVKYNVNVGNGLQKDDTGNTISVKPADSSLVVDGNGVKVNTGTINNVTTGDKPGTVEANTGDENKVATVGNVVNAINNAAWTATSAATAAGELGATAANQLVKAGDTVTFEADKNIKITQNAGKFTFATKDNVSFETVQVGGDQGPKFSKTDAGDIKVSGPNDTDPVKITNVQDGEVSSTSKDAINGSQFHAVAKNTIKLAGQNGTDTATETNGQNLDQTGGIKFTIKSSDGTLLDVAASGDTITLTPKTGTITTTDGVPTATTTNGKLVTADEVVNALKEMGWKATAGNEGTGTVTGNALELIKAGETVTFKAGDNLAVKQDGKNFIYSLKTELTGLTSGEFKNIAGDKTVINGDGVTITPVTNGKSPVSLTTNGLNNGGNPITNVTSNLVNYNDPDVNGVQPAKNSLRNLDNNAVPDTNAATVGDLRNMGWIVSSDKKTDDLTKDYSDTVKNANEVKFVGAGTAIVSGKTDDKGVRTITVKVDDQTSTNNAVTPVVYTDKDGNQVYPTGKKDAAGNQIFNTKPDGSGDTVTGPVKTTINGPKGTDSPTTLSNVEGNLDGAKTNTTAPTTNHEGVDTTNPTAANYVNPHNAATVGDVLQAGWNLQGNGTAKDFVRPYDTVNFINGDGTTATVESTDGKTSTVKYSVNLGNGLQKDDTGNTISVKPADSSLVVDGNGVKVNTGTINNVTTGDKPGTVEANTGDENKVATVGNVVNAINNAAWTATSAATAAGELGATAANQLVKAGDTVTFEADKNIKITQNAGKFTFATKDNVSFETVQVGGDQGPKLSKTDDGDLKVSGPNGTDPVKVTNVKSGLNKYGDTVDGNPVAGTTTANTGLIDLSKPATGEPKVSDNTAATVGDLRNMGWIVSSDKQTDDLTKDYSDTVKNANEVKFVGEGTAIVSGKTDDKGVRTITVKVDDQTSTNNSVTPVNYTKKDGTKVYPKMVKNPDTGTEELKFFEKPDGSGNEVQKGDVITSINGPEGTTKPTTLSNVEGNLDGAKTGTTAPTTNAAAPTLGTANNQLNPHNAATVGDVLQAGWNLQNNGEARDFVKPYDTVNFINGLGTTAVVTTHEGNTTSDVTFNVKAANRSVTVDEDGVKVTTGEMKPAVDANNKETGAIATPADPATAKQLKDTLDAAVKELATAKDALKTAETALAANPTDPALQKAVEDKKVDVAAKQTPVTEAQKAHDEAGLNKVATVQNVAEAINNAGFNLKTSADGGEKLTTGSKNDGELIRPSNTVEMVAGNNLTVKQDANGKITYATKDNVTFTNVDTGTLNVGSPNTYTDGKGNTYTKVGDKYYNPTDVVNGAPKQDVTPVTIPADVVVKPVSPVTMKTEAAKPATNNIIDAQPSSALNITSQDGKPTQITGVGSTLNTNVVKTTPEGTATKPGAAPGTTPKTEDVHLVDLNGTKDAPVNKNAAATVGDLQNMGWVVSTKDGNGYKDVVKNANVVDFKGAQGVTVTGTTLADGTREITIGVATGDVTNKVTITHADGTKTEAVKIGDNYYKVDENGKPVGFEKDKDGKPAGTPLTINPTTDSVTNKGAGFVTGNTVANAIQDSGWNIGKANGSDAVKSDGTAVDFNKEAKVYDKVNPNDDVKFVDGANTNVSMVTVDALNEDGTKKATTFVKVDINRDLKIDSVTTGGTAVDKNGNNLVKVGDKYYKEGDVTLVTNPDGSTTVTPKKDAKPVPPADVIPPKDGAMIVKNADGKDVVSATVGKDGSGVFAVNGKDGKDGVSITAKDGQGAIGVNGKDGNNTSITGENISIKDKDNNSTSIGINNVTLKDKDGNISTLTADKSELKDKAGNTNTNTSTANILKDPNGNTNTSTASTSELKDKNGNTNTSTPTTNVLKDTNGNTNTSTAGGTTYTDKDANKTVVGPKEIAITDKSGDNKASLTNKDLILNAKDPKTGVDKTSHVSGDKIAFTTTDEIEKVVDKDGKPVIDPTTGKQKEVIKNPGNSTEYTNEGLKVIPNSIVARDANGNLTFLDKDGKPVSKDTDGHYKYVGQDGKPGEKYTGAVGSLKPNVADSTRIISFGMDKPVLDSNGNPVKGPDGKTVMTEGISAGMQQIHNVAPGTKDTDAVNVSQLRGTTININNRVNRMGAQAAALAGLQSIQYDPLEPTQISAGVGYYQGASALALGMNHYKNESTMFHVGASVNGNMNEVMANASVTWKFGARADETAVKDTFRQGPISASYTLQDKVSALEAQNRVQKEQLETLKALNEKQQEQIAELFKRLSEKA